MENETSLTIAGLMRARANFEKSFGDPNMQVSEIVCRKTDILVDYFKLRDQLVYKTEVTPHSKTFMGFPVKTDERMSPNIIRFVNSYGATLLLINVETNEAYQLRPLKF